MKNTFHLPKTPAPPFKKKSKQNFKFGVDKIATPMIYWSCSKITSQKKQKKNKRGKNTMKFTDIQNLINDQKAKNNQIILDERNAIIQDIENAITEGIAQQNKVIQFTYSTYDKHYMSYENIYQHHDKNDIRNILINEFEIKPEYIIATFESEYKYFKIDFTELWNN